MQKWRFYESLEKFWGHLGTILHHKKLVRHYCFRAGLYKQGIMHDWSKYSPVEFIAGVRNYQGGKKAQTSEKKRHKDIPLHGFIIKDATAIITNTGLISL